MSVCLSVSEQSQTDAPIWTQFSQIVAYRSGSDPIEIGDLGHGVKCHGHSDAIFNLFHNSLLTFILCISALLRLIKIKFGKSVCPC